MRSDRECWCLRQAGDETRDKESRSHLYHVLLSVLLHLHQIQGQKQNKRGGRNEAAAPVEQLALPAFCLEMRIMPPTEDRKHGAPVAAAAQPCQPCQVCEGRQIGGNDHEV